MSPNRPPRAPGFSYVGVHRYFLTICTDRRRRWFDHHGSAAWLTDQILRIFNPSDFAVVAYCVMPDHVHLLLEGLTDGADLRAAVRDWKRRTGFAWKRLTGQRLRQSGFHDYVLRDEDAVPGVVRYLVGNPVRAGLIDDAGRYPHSGSSRYRMADLLDVVDDWRPSWK